MFIEIVAEFLVVHNTILPIYECILIGLIFGICIFSSVVEIKFVTTRPHDNKSCDKKG